MAASAAAASAAVAAAMSVVIVWSSTVFLLVFESALALIGRSFGPFQSVLLSLSLSLSIHPSILLLAFFLLCLSVLESKWHGIPFALCLYHHHYYYYYTSIFFVSCLLSSRRCGLRPAPAAIRHLYAPDDERRARTTERLIALADMLLYRCIFFSSSLSCFLCFFFYLSLSLLAFARRASRETKVVLSLFLVFKASRMMIMYSDNRVTHYIDLLSAAAPSQAEPRRAISPAGAGACACLLLFYFFSSSSSFFLSFTYSISSLGSFLSCPGQNVSFFFL